MARLSFMTETTASSTPHFLNFLQYFLIVRNDTLPAMENPFVEWQDMKIDN